MVKYVGHDREELLAEAEDGAGRATAWSSDGDLIVLTIGEPIGKSGGTNTMKIVKVGERTPEPGEPGAAHRGRRRARLGVRRASRNAALAMLRETVTQALARGCGELTIWLTIRAMPRDSTARKTARKPPAPAFVRDADARRARILDAATAGVRRATAWPARASTASPSAADANKRMLYYYFGNKEALFLAVLEARLRAHPRGRAASCDLLDLRAGRGGAPAGRVHVELLPRASRSS